MQSLAPLRVSFTTKSTVIFAILVCLVSCAKVSINKGVLMLSDDSLDILFRKARSHNGWLDKEVSTEQLKQIYTLMKYGPTSANSCPMRLVFIISKKEKVRLKNHLDRGNIEKSMQAPVVAVVAYDREFYQKLPVLFPHDQNAKNWFAGNEEKNHYVRHYERHFTRCLFYVSRPCTWA